MPGYWNMARLFTIVIICSVCIKETHGDICYATRTRAERRERYTSTSCGWWGRRCTHRIVYYTTTTYRTSYCCRGYTGASCTTPVCNPPCRNNGICYDVNKCYCRPGSSGSSCGDPVFCTAENDCYPGSCYGSNNCRCSSGFRGSSCTTIRDGGSFNHCKARITNTGSSGMAYETDCAAPNANVFANNANLDNLVLDWEVKWEPPSDIPNAPSYIIESKPGIINSYANVDLKNSGGSNKRSSRKQCEGHDVSSTDPHHLVQCRDIGNVFPGEMAAHLDTLEVTFYSQTGGFKRFQHGHDISQRSYSGSTASKEVEIKFDLQDPYHCSAKGECDASEPAIGVYPDTSMFTSVRVEIFGWKDADSGLKECQLQLYQMEYSTSKGKLVMKDVLNAQTWNLEGEWPEFDVRDAGVYSIVMEIYDNAGNSARARTIIFVDPYNNIDVNREKAISVTPSADSDNGVWIESSGDISIEWDGIFSNNRHKDNHFLDEVETMTSLLDDQDGNRTTVRVENSNGMVRFEVGYKIQSILTLSETGDELRGPFVLENMARSDGDVIELIVKGYDLAGHSRNSTLRVRVDSSPPEIMSIPKMKTNVPSEREDMFYTSRLTMRIVDRQSGVGKMKFTVMNANQQIHQEVQKAHVMEGTTEDECSETGACYCTTYGDCYEYEQSIWISNCWFVDQPSSAVSVSYSAVNNAGQEDTDTYFVGEMGTLNGIGHYPTPENIATTRDKGESIDVIWFLPPTCHPYQTIIITYIIDDKTHIATMGGDATRYTLHGLKADSTFQLSMEVIFEDGTSTSSETYTFSTKPIVVEKPLRTGGIVGIVIAAIIFLLLVAALIIMFIRYKREKHPVPLIIREKTSALRDGISRRFSRYPTADLNEMEKRTYDNNHTESDRAKSMVLDVVQPDMEDDMYIYGTMETDANASWKYSGDSLKIKGKVPGAKGKFADIKFGMLRLPNGEQQKVVVKMNKVGASEEDKLLMKAKMNYLATQVPSHEFIVNMVGAIPPPKGPMILFENCDLGSLLDWLKKLVKVTGDTEEQMVMFTIQTAKGMQHLHDKGILHRRLGARNVLLQTDPSTKQIRAKLTGFGPLKGEQEGGDSRQKDRIPFRWMAPEQFDKPEGEKRHYSKETDVWSYGILVWEIFSKGETPYPEHSNVAELKAAVLNGYRMGQPDDSPAFMYTDIMTPAWEESPHMRPNFDITLAKLEREYGSQHGENYDYDPETATARSIYSNALSSLAMQVD